MVNITINIIVLRVSLNKYYNLFSKPLDLNIISIKFGDFQILRPVIPMQKPAFPCNTLELGRPPTPLRINTWQQVGQTQNNRHARSPFLQAVAEQLSPVVTKTAMDTVV